MKLKPLPKLILIVAVVGLAGFGISTALKNRAPAVDPNAAPAPAVTTVTPPAPNAVATPAPVAPAPAPVAEAPAPAPAPALQPATPSDAGLANVLGGKK